jgi:hypothetical protein
MWKYYFGVRVDARLETAGELSLDFVIELSEEDMKNLERAASMVTNEIWKTSNKEALAACKIEHLTIISAMKHRAFANNLSLHMIHCDFKLTNEDLRMWVSSCNHDSDAKQKLMDSRVSRESTLGRKF